MIVIDTSALIAILMGEAEAPQFEDALADAGEILLSTGTLMEIQVVLFRKQAAHLLPMLDAYIERARMSITAVTERQAIFGRDAFRRYGQGSGHPAALNFGDCFAYALAKESGAPLLFKGDDFRLTDIVAVA